MKITAIKAQVKNPNRVSVFVDEKYSFSLTPTQLLEQKLRVGLEVSEADIAACKRASDFGKAYERALNYALLRPHSRKEMEDYCRRKKWPPEDCVLIIEKLVARRYVDDTSFARSWVQSRALARKTSQRKLRMELQQKGVANEIITDALAATDFNEADALEALIIKKRRLARFQDDQKLFAYLARQGFSLDAIKQALDRQSLS